MKAYTIQKILGRKIIAIVRGVYGDACVKLAEALYDGGIELLEVTFDQKDPAALEKTPETIRLLDKTLGNKMLFGAGTVTSTQMAAKAHDAGAKFIISPDVNADVIHATLAANMVSIPGALTPTEILTAYQYGADFVKVFPAGSIGTGYLKAISAPINHIPLLAVGGISETNIKTFLDAGASGIGIGGNIVNKEWIQTGQFEKITELAHTLTNSI